MSAGGAFYTVLTPEGHKPVATFPADLEKSEQGEGQFKISLNNFLDNSYEGYAFWYLSDGGGSSSCGLGG